MKDENDEERIQEMLLSRRSSELNSEMLALKRKNENFFYTLGILTKFF